MAEAIFNAMAAERSLSARAESCGLAAFPGDPAATHAVAAAAAFGADLSAHRSRRASSYLLEQADRVFCMTRGHLKRLAADFPEYAGKAALLDTEDIPDPWGMDLDTYFQTAETIAKAIETLLEAMSGEQDGI